MSKVSKVVLGNDTVMDITDSTVNANNLLSGEVAYGADGERVVGEAVIPTVNNGILIIKRNGVDVQTFTANQSTNVSANILVPTTASEVNAIATSDKGAANGVAELDANGKVPNSQLPSYVDDVLEYDSLSSFPSTGESGKIYVAKDTNKTYRWSGTAYVEISPSLALGETSSTAYRGDRGKTAYDHSQTTSGNPHNVTKSDVGLGNVPNVSTNDQTPTFTTASTRANITSGEKLSVILGKISKFFTDLKTVAFTGAYTDLTGTPTIPTVNNGTLTVTQNGTSKGTFTANQSGNATIALTDTTYSSKAAASGGTDVSLVTTGEKYTWNNKVDKVNGKGLSTNDYTNEEKTKLAGISAGAEPNVQSDWKQSDSSSDDFIKNKPTSDIKTSNNGQFTTVTGGLMQSCIVDLEPIQSGSGTPSPSNVRAISGHTQVQVGNCGKNKLLSITSAYTTGGVTYTPLDDGTVSANGTATAWASYNWLIHYPIKAGSYILSGTPSVSGSYITLIDETTNNTWNSVGGNSAQVVLQEDTLVTVRVSASANTVLNNAIYKPMLRYLTETDTTFEPYNGYTTTINLGGTYYGGTLDAVSGVLTVTHGIIGANDFDTFASGTSGGGLYYVQTNSSGSKLDANGICNMLAVDNQNAWTSTVPVAQISNSQEGRIRVYCNSTSLSNFKSEYAGLQICFELATPITIQLDPQTLETLVGQNDVFAPLVGQSVEEVEFREVMAIDDVPKAIPYENVAPDMGTGEDRTYFRIKKYGRLVQLEFIQSNYWMVVEQQTKVVFGVLPDGYYDKQPWSALHPDVEYKYPFVNETATNQYDNRKLFINMVTGEVYSVYQANDEIHPMGSITYILDHD